MVFNAGIWWWRGSTVGLEFLTGYLVEWSLSMDNVFVFAVIFRFFQVPMQYQYRVAVDSVPAIFGITRDPFIIFTSNIFAILGLRALYFLLAGVIEMFRFLHDGLSAVLGFIGLKMISEWLIPHLPGFLRQLGMNDLAERWQPWAEHPHVIPPWASLVVIAVLLTIAIVAFVLEKRAAPLGAEGEVQPDPCERLRHGNCWPVYRGDFYGSKYPCFPRKYEVFGVFGL